MTSHDEIREIALAEFANAGYAGTSLHRIAELAGLSKSSVLYHFSSKEALLEATIGPACGRMEQILDRYLTVGLADEERLEFLGQFVDFLLEYCLETHLFINQGPSLVDVPAIDRANLLVYRLAEFFSSSSETLEEKMRFGVALGGAAYMLCTSKNLDLDVGSPEETRVALLSIMSQLLAPVPHH